MDIKNETIPSYAIAFIRHKGPYGEGNKQAMETLKSLARLNDLLNDDSIILGIAQDDPVKTKPENCRYDACIVLAGNSHMHDASLSYGTVAGGKYAVFTIEHTLEAIQRAWNEIFAELTTRNYKIDEKRPIIERYSVRNITRHRCEICVPVY